MSFIQTMCGGRLVRDPEVAYSNSGMAIAKFCLVVDKPKKQGQAKADVNFFNFTVFGKLAELIGNGRFVKGDYMLITSCRPDINEWTGKDGQKHKDLVFIVNSIEFTNSKKQTNSAPSSFDNMGGSIGMDVDF